MSADVAGLFFRFRFRSDPAFQRGLTANDFDEDNALVEFYRHVHWVVTEYGAIDLWGRSLRERAEALISIAHPDFRAELRRRIDPVRRFILTRPSS